LFFRILFSDEEHLCNAPLTMVSDFLKSMRGLGAVQ